MTRAGRRAPAMSWPPWDDEKAVSQRVNDELEKAVGRRLLALMGATNHGGGRLGTTVGLVGVEQAFTRAQNGEL